MQNNHRLYMIINAAFIQLVRCSLVSISVLKLVVLFPDEGVQDVGESVAKTQADMYPIKYRTKPAESIVQFQSS